MQPGNFNVKGLSNEEVAESRKTNGTNSLNIKEGNPFLSALQSLAKEPMVVLLLVASLIYFLGGHTGDALFLTGAIILVAAISLYQDKRSRVAVEKLKDLSQPHCKVIREGKLVEVKSEDIVIGDALMVEEGTLIVADGYIIQSNDFSVNEAILTGESLPVYKSLSGDNKEIYKGTVVSSGLAIATITAIGNNTRLGQISKSLENISEEKTPLEKQIFSFVKRMVVLGAVIFLLVWSLNYFRSFNILDSLLKALTLAMSILPEEIPVALTTFMALGAWRLMKMGILVKDMKTVETLGSATVICTDKTGTITENRMSIAKIYAVSSRRLISAENLNGEEKDLLYTAMWASEPIPFDPMEKAIHQQYTILSSKDERPEYKMIHEYPLDGKPPMMTHIFENAAGQRIIAAKGAPEALLQISQLTEEEKAETLNSIQQLTEDGYRVLGVGSATFTGDIFPEKQQLFGFKFKGLLAFYDPPKKNIPDVFKAFYTAGLQVKIITGDNAATTKAIARQVGFKESENCLLGEDLINLSDMELQEKVMSTNIFARMFPEAKLRVIQALKAQNQIVAMTGDGVNDAPALKASHIGIAMGNKGTEIARQAASLILINDDLQGMVDAIAMGRKIYNNLKKAIQYIISIHIPIVLTVFIPLVLGWVYPNIFYPVHIIFLELIMGPTCSVIYENEPMEKDTMARKPRPFSTTFFQWRELATSFLQGLAITAGTLTGYQYAVHSGFDEMQTRTITFVILICSNIFLTLVNRSFYFSVLETLHYKNPLVPLMIAITLAITISIVYVPALAHFFDFRALNILQLLVCIGISFCSVIWFEAVKAGRRVISMQGFLK